MTDEQQPSGSPIASVKVTRYVNGKRLVVSRAIVAGELLEKGAPLLDEMIRSAAASANGEIQTALQNGTASKYEVPR